MKVKVQYTITLDEEVLAALSFHYGEGQITRKGIQTHLKTNGTLSLEDIEFDYERARRKGWIDDKT